MGEKDNVKDLEIKNEKMYDVAEMKKNLGIAKFNWLLNMALPVLFFKVSD